MSVRLLLGSGGFRTPGRVALLAGQMHAFFGDVRRLLFVPYALADHDGYAQMVVEKGWSAGYAIDPVHRHADPVAAVRDAEGILVGGGNTFRLLHALYELGLLEAIRDQVTGRGLPYMGVSAGTNVACPTIKTTNDMPIVQPPSLAALNLVPFQVNPHYYHGATFLKEGDGFVEHFGETRDERIREFHEMNDAPVVGLWEGGLLRVEAGGVTLIGAAARVFRKGREPVDVGPGARLDEMVSV
ncbi:MAG TPA: dipeptidase PepE [Gemmataceae bacterium]